VAVTSDTIAGPKSAALSVNFWKSKQALLFVNKKKQKNFNFFDVTRTVEHRREADQKFFAAFFQKSSASLNHSPTTP
jgi:hypothetical protein